MITVAAVVVILLIVWYIWKTREMFATKREKAEAIAAWFQSNPAGSYRDYKYGLNRASNIVEYEDARKLQSAGKLNADAIASLL
jgi:hypothetical protein